MIERLQAGDWDPDNHDADRLNRDVLAARGYWQAFQLFRDDVTKIIAGDESVALISSSHREWYRELLQPCVAVGLISPSALAGYRNDAVFLRGSRHVPPRSEAVRDAMPALFALLAEEAEPPVRAGTGASHDS